jgi:diguanylate cyclase (GGDEF)-like protein
MAEVVLMISISMSLIYKFRKNTYTVAQGIILIGAILLGIILYRIQLIGFFNISSIMKRIFIIAIISFNILLANKDEKIFSQALLNLLISEILIIFESIRIISYISTVFKCMAYFHLYIYFFKKVNFTSRNKEKIIEKEKGLYNKFSKLEFEKQLFYMKLKNERLLNLAQRDELTQAYNKRTILDIIEKSIKSRKRFSVLMYEIDNFKKINDVYGHITGDKAIKNLAQISKRSIRDVDSLGRYGGDEFIIVLPDISHKGAIHVAERLRDNVSCDSIPRFTVSIGIASYPNDGKTGDELIEIADKGLYMSKEKGKNALSHGRIM